MLKYACSKGKPVELPKPSIAALEGTRTLSVGKVAGGVYSRRLASLEKVRAGGSPKDRWGCDLVPKVS